MLTDYSDFNQAFVDGMKAFLDYSEPDSLRSKEGLMVRRRLSKEDFERRCIQRWAVSELIDSIVNNPYDPVEETTYRLALKLLYFAKNATNASMMNVFIVAEDFIEKHIINLFRTNDEIHP